jgi:hypothetical protein
MIDPNLKIVVPHCIHNERLNLPKGCPGNHGSHAGDLEARINLRQLLDEPKDGNLLEVGHVAAEGHLLDGRGGGHFRGHELVELVEEGGHFRAELEGVELARQEVVELTDLSRRE